MNFKKIALITFASALFTGCAATDDGGASMDSFTSLLNIDTRISYKQEPSMSRSMDLSSKNSSVNTDNPYHQKVYLYTYRGWPAFRIHEPVFPAFKGESKVSDKYDETDITDTDVIKNATNVILQEKGLLQQGFASSADYKLSVIMKDYYSETMLDLVTVEQIAEGLKTGIAVQFTLEAKDGTIIADQLVKHEFVTPVKRKKGHTSIGFDLESYFPYIMPESKYANIETQALQEVIEKFLSENLQA